MLDNPGNHNSRKRVLKKVRTHFVNKTPEETTLATPLYQSQRFLSDKSVHILNSCIGLVETNRKIEINIHFLNSVFIFSTSMFKENGKPGQVTLNSKMNPDPNFPSYEYVIKRLESFGDLELATWAFRIKKYYELRVPVLDKYFEMVNSTDHQVQTNLRKIKNNAVLACREIEDNYAYRKLTFFSNINMTQLLSTTFSEGLLKLMGHNLEEFAQWTEQHGFPKLFENDGQIHMDMAKNFLECSTIRGGKAINELPEFITNIIDKHGKKKEVLAQYIYILDPTAEGFFLYGYIIFKDEESLQKKKAEKLVSKTDFNFKLGLDKTRLYEEGEEDEAWPTSKHGENKEKTLFKKFKS